MINIMLCTSDSEKLVEFYRAVGMELVKEKHGSSPEHHAFQAPVCAEIYPPRQPQDAGFILRLDVADVDSAMSKLKARFDYPDLVVREAETLRTGRKSIVRDPDGRIVELFQAMGPS